MEELKEKDKKTILVVDDEPNIVDMLTCNLEREGYNTIAAGDGYKAIDLALKEKPDLILLDVMIPGPDGVQVCKQIRNNLTVPILMISAKDDEVDKIVGLEMGADDYITKPFSIRELIARVKANLRKTDMKLLMDEKNVEEVKEESDDIIEIGDLRLDLNKYEVRVRGEVVDLTLREFEVLKYLAKQPEQVTTREVLLEKVWGYEYYGDIRTVDVTISRIRKRIEEDSTDSKILMTKRGVGYFLATK